MNVFGGNPYGRGEVGVRWGGVGSEGSSWMRWKAALDPDPISINRAVSILSRNGVLSIAITNYRIVTQDTYRGITKIHM